MVHLIALLLAGCDGCGSPDDTGVAPDDTGGPYDDTGETDTVGEWTVGPALPDCTPQTGDGDQVALSGVALTPDGPVAGVVVYSRSTGTLSCIGPECDTTGAEVVCTTGVITPGLIDPHDHMQYNVLSPWQHEELYESRYDWQSDGDYYDYRDAYDGVEDAYYCEIGKWAELRLVVSGGTTVVGSSGGDCLNVLARNLDEGEDAHGIDGYDMDYNSGRAEYLDSGDGADATDDLSNGTYGAILNHVAEGVDESVAWEIDHMVDIGMDGPGHVYVHATDGSTAQLAQMSSAGTAIVWSPRSNLDLYLGTTHADVARRMGVTVALGPDWTWSGSANPFRELSCARDYIVSRSGDISDVELWEMATTDAARVVGLDGVLGTLTEGAKADIAVFSFSTTPYRAVIRANPEDVLLTVVDGQALYGDPDMVSLLAASPDWCETVDPCGEGARSLCVKASETGDDAQTHAELESTLSAALAAQEMPKALEYANDLFGLWVCEETRASCDVADPGPDDLDGDGADDADDVCEDVYDPLQRDHDGDGVGDACDPCPLMPDSEDCRHDPDDMDDDDLRNDEDNCPWHHNPDQSDGDGDDKGDSCDECPEDANPGDEACPAISVTIRDLRDPSDADHPDDGTRVEVTDVVVTAVRFDSGSSFGFFVQDSKESDYGGIYVYVGEEIEVDVGDVVTVDGEYTEYYDLSEIAYATVTVTGTSALPDPIDVSNPCAIATDGGDAERFESMLVEVTGVEVSNSAPDDPDDYDEFEVDGCLRIDDLLCDDCWDPEPEVGTSYTRIIGPLYYGYSNFKLVPRDSDDLE